MLLSAVLAIILRFNFSDGLQKLFWDHLDDCTTCVGYGAVFRVSFATFVFFLAHALLLLAPICWRIDTFSWLGKFLAWVGLLVVAFLLPEEFYSDFYVHVARVVAGGFLFLQVVLLIDFAHTLNESWNEKEWRAAIVVVSLVLLLGSLAMLILFFIWWGSCVLHQFFIALTLCGTFLLCVLCVLERFSEKGGLLPAAVVTAYCWWLCYSGISSDPSDCNTRGEQGTAQLIIGILIAALSIAYAGWSTGTHKSLFGVAEEAAAKNLEEKAQSEIEMGVVGGAGGDNGDAARMELEAQAGDSELALVARRNIRFHLLMAACAMYMSMLLTNWGSIDAARQIDRAGGDLTGRAYDLSAESMWLKFATQWATMLLFGWSVVAPVVCKGRDFN